MLEVKNHTPFEAGLTPSLDVDNREFLSIIVKGTFALTPSGAAAGELEPADEQVPVHYAPVYHGEDGTSSLRYDSDGSPTKPSTDVVLVGSVRPPRRARKVDVTLEMDGRRKTARVIGDRRWTRSLGMVGLSEPEMFESMPLTWERSFGGLDTSADNPKKHGWEPRNPVGTGYVTNVDRENLDGLLLPNIEDPTALIRGPKDKPAPIGFGFVAPNWEPRRGFGGTYDAAWESTRCPLLPLDFDPRFYHGAPADQIAPRRLKGGEPLRVEGMTPAGELGFLLPTRRFHLTVFSHNERKLHAPLLDTVVIEPDEARVSLTWRATIPCPRSLKYIEWVLVQEQR